MQVNIRYFASIRETIGVSQERVETSGQTLSDLRSELIARGGTYAECLASGRALRMALNQVMADEDAVLVEGAEVAFFPPVTGG